MSLTPATGRRTLSSARIEDLADGERTRVGWLVLVYRVPSAPPRVRATVRRRLKSLGAIYLQNSTAALPSSLAAERAMRRLRHEILKMSGTAIVLSCDLLVGEQQVRAAFITARNDEYEQIIQNCKSFVSGVEEEIGAQRAALTFLQEQEVALRKLQKQFVTVCDRDVFEAPRRRGAASALARADEAIGHYAELLHATEPLALRTT